MLPVHIMALMRIASTLVIAAISVSFVLPLAGDVQAQASGDDSARSRGVRQAGAPLTGANDSIFRRAEQLVREGRGEAGRALVDTVLAGTRPGSLQHGQALYWRASLAADAAEAERGYRQVILEYAATRWAGDALLNVAQLEMARGDQEQALVHLHRFEREYTSHDSRARASFWLARLYFDRKNDRRGCASLATARVAVSPEDVELRNQIDYHGQRCIGVDTAIAVPTHRTAGATTTVSAPVSSTPPAVTAPPVTPASTPIETATGAPPNAPVSAPQATGAPPSARHPAPSTPAADSQPVPLVVPTVMQTPASVGAYTVQVAAYDSRPAAEALIARLKSRGYSARLGSTVRPFRVRIGRYDTRADALAAQQRLKAKGLDGFVTEMESP